MRTGLPAAYFAIKAFSETDMTEDLKKIDVPTLKSGKAVRGRVIMVPVAHLRNAIADHQKE
jgi:hypothetical protein